MTRSRSETDFLCTFKTANMNYQRPYAMERQKSFQFNQKMIITDGWRIFRTGVSPGSSGGVIKSLLG